MLTILNDPSGITGRQSHELDYSLSLQENIERHLAGGADCELQINGVRVDPLTDPRLDAPPSVLDRVVVLRRPGAEMAIFLVAAAFAAASAVLYSMIPKPPDSGTQNESPNNKLTAQTNIARTYQAIPDVYGFRRIWPDLIQPSTIEYIDNVKYVTEWMCASRGKGTVSAVQYADTPIGDISESSYELFEPVPVDGYPEFGTTTLNDVFETFASDEVNGQEIVYAEDDGSGGWTLTTIGPYTLPVACDRLWWNVVFLRGLKGGVFEGVDIKAEWWQIDGDGVEVPGTRQDQTFNYFASTFDQKFFTEKVTPAAGEGIYRIQFTRVSLGQRDDGADVAKLEEVYAVRYYPTKVLPGVTVLRVTTKATLAATGFSDRKFNIRWFRHVRTLSSDALGVSRNFGRIIAHIWTIAGNDISGLDTGTLAGVINAEHGENSPLLRFDGSLDDADMSLGERMQLVANMARCVIWRDGAKWTATRDQAREFPELQLDYRNLAADGESAIGYAAHLPASNDGVEVEYVDETTQAKKSYIRLDISSGAPVVGASSNPKKIALLGCTTEEQASNRAQLEARRLLFQRVSVNDTALSDGHSLGIGSLVRWIDPNDFAGDDGLQAGEVLAVDGLTITTSEQLDFKGETSGRILFTGEDGKHLGAPIVCTPAAGGATLAGLPAGLYVADAARQLGSRYAFGVGLTEAEIDAAGLYTVTEVKPAADGKVGITLALYDDRIYGAD